ncbi:TetR/AcrR family transcriptional regulator [Herbidospora sp. NBRC 101105]|uniref:TetR/AcrR family transcriptional regulator n=1 Tax=Herbidospora sp. NBRC 101105 TaxID=3032195 RepID=UPI0024A257A5|nr:TetR/AcrR family transcriptional regulator [Herbidospora sp. NBRC 101105]GLX92332.1 TetR family transcriptional regulator [Herbidospora sp. NBRC 101105]
MSAAKTARERVRAEMVREITDIARTHLAREGAAGLSLRAIAREMGMASSAIHRYFPTKDDLLTALIVDGYNALGEAAEASQRDQDPAARWLALCHAVRDFALDRPHEYALLYGSPVPGYRAPADTVAPALRATLVCGRIIADADPAPPDSTPPPALLGPDLEALRQVMPGVSDVAVARAVTAWTALFGAVSFELFGQFDNTITHRREFFDHGMRSLARYLGL